MSFFQLEFFVFLGMVIAVCISIKANVPRKWVLLFASYYFYAYWDIRFLPLLLFPTFLDFGIGKLLGTLKREDHRKAVVSVSLIVNLGILWIFKYYNFFIDSLKLTFEPVGFNLDTISIMLPLGISFYTFSTLTYTIEVYRKNIEPCESLLDYALYIAFFPKIMAGPICRAANLLQQFKAPASMGGQEFVIGFTLFVSGFFIKVFLADRLAGFVNPIFDAPGVFSGFTLWLGAVAYSLQIYFDFAGYSQMAIGIAAMLGYKLEKNFDFPYLSCSISEFWKRWHISLSSWIRDYIYIPFGGNRKGDFRTYVNLLLAMSLCGLWHGAAWTYVLWGVYHGVAIGANRMWANLNNHHRNEDTTGIRFLKWLSTMMVVIVGWVLFRSESLSAAMIYIHGMFMLQNGVGWIHPFFIFALLGTTLSHVIVDKLNVSNVQSILRNSWCMPFLVFCLLWLAIIFRAEDFQPFIYGEF